MSEERDINLNDINKKDLKSYILNNKKILITIIAIFLIILFSFFFYFDYKKDLKVKISDQYNLAIINFEKNNPNQSIDEMINIIN